MADCDSFLVLFYRQKLPLAYSLMTVQTERLMSGCRKRMPCAVSFCHFGQRFDEAVTEFERAIALDYNSFEAHSFMGAPCRR